MFQFWTLFELLDGDGGLVAGREFGSVEVDGVVVGTYRAMFPLKIVRRVFLVTEEVGCVDSEAFIHLQDNNDAVKSRLPAT